MAAEDSKTVEFLKNIKIDLHLERVNKDWL